MTRILRYVLMHDTGMAPCVDDGLVSLATCKPGIRKSAKPGEWVVGCRPGRTPRGLVVWAGRVGHVLAVGDYERRHRGRSDAVYRAKPDGGFKRLRPDYHPEADNFRKDTSAPVLVFDREETWYFGREPHILPEHLMHLAAAGQGHRVNGVNEGDVEAPLAFELSMITPPKQVPMTGAIDGLLRPARIFSALEVLGRPSPVPATSGIYAWYFAELPGGVSAEGCHLHDGKWLLYVGISPSAPPSNGKQPSRSTIRRRLLTHYGGNAYGSTLRLTLGCLLSDQLALALRRVGSGGRYTFTNPGEQRLDAWMAANAFVAWESCDRPWEVEEKVLASGLPLPLNIAGNPCAAHVEYLSPIRRAARRQANDLDIVADSGGPRKPPRWIS